MNYYAKIVAEKHNAKFKVGDKVALGEIVKGPIKMKLSQTPVYEIKTPEGKIISKYEEEIKRNEKEEKTNEDTPFTKKRECLATLDRMLYYVQRKKSQVQQWKYIDEDFDENEFLSDLKDALRSIEGIMG